jgi:hypothetical protein
MVKTKRLASVAAVLGLAAVGVMAMPHNANAWWRRGIWIAPVYVVPPPVYYAPPVVYTAPPVAYYAPRRFWVPPHWEGPYWVRGHWG